MLSVCFAMDQVAGHVANYRNLRDVVDAVDDVRAEWLEVPYHVEGGLIERVRDRVPFVPQYVAGVGRAAYEMRAGLVASDADVVFTNATVAVFFARRLRSTPTLYDFDSTPIQLDAMPAYTPVPDPAPVARAKYLVQRRLFRAASVLQAWSTWAADSVVADYGIDRDRIVINPPGVDLTRWTVAGRRHPSATGRPARVLFVGGDFVRKGGQDLLAWHATRDPSEVELDIVTREHVEPRDGVRVHRDLSPNQPELVELYNRADVYVLPSHGECFGIATIEAMASGLPVVQSDVGGAADIVEAGGNGHLVPAREPRQLGAAIEDILSEPGRWDSMRARSRALAEERFDVVANAAVTLGHLRRLAVTSRSA